MISSFRQTSSALSWLIHIIKASKWSILLLTILQSLMAVFTTLYPIITLQVLNAVEQRNRLQFQHAILLFICFIICQLVIWYILALYSERVSFAIENRLKRFCLTAWLQRQHIYQSTLHTGELMNRLSSDIRTITDGCISIVPNLLSLIVRLIVTIVLLYLLLPQMAYIMIVGGLGMLVATTFIRQKIKQLHKAVNEKDGYVRSYLQEVFQNPIIIRSFGVEEDVFAHVNGLIEDHRAIFRQRLKLLTTSQLVISIVFNAAIIIGTTLASIRIMDQQMALGTYVAVAQLIGQLRGPLVSLTGFIPRYFTMIASVERLVDINPQADMTMDLLLSHEDYLPMPQAIVFDGVGFSYTDDEETALADFSLVIRRGEHLGIVGQSGGGKSTFLKLLIGVYQHQRGQISLVYPEGSKQISAEQLATYRHLFAYVPQSNALMSGTIREIVSFSDTSQQTNDERLRQALTVACAWEFVEQLPKGLDTSIKEAGEGVSGGQMQRLAIARAIFSDRPFLVLDEATSALDARTEEELLHNLQTMTDKTIILVTHRQQALNICDKIIDFNDMKGISHDTDTLISSL